MDSEGLVMDITRILIVEDEALVAEDLKIQIEDIGYINSGIVASGEDALAFLKTSLPDLILMDIMLSGKLDGIDVAKIIKEKYQIPVIYLTAYSDQENLDRALKTEPYGYILKPFDEQALSTTISMGLYKAEHDRQLHESEMMLEKAQQISKIGHWRLQSKTGIVIASDFLRQLFEKEPIDSLGSLIKVVHPDDRKVLGKRIEMAIEEARGWELTHRIMTKSQGKRWVHSIAEVVTDENGSVLELVATVQDITEQRESQNTIELYANVFKHSAEAILISDYKNRIIAINLAFTELSGYTIDDVIGKNPQILSSGQTPKVVYHQMWQSLQEKGHWQGEMIDRKKDGSLYPKWMSISVSYDDEGNLNHYIASFSDISERKAVEERIFHLAHHDSLTGLLNRFSLEERLEQIVSYAQREIRKIAVLFIDLDRFKVINDTLGHHVGDELLKEVAKRLKSSVRDSDIVARIGGDEFVVVLSNIEDSTMVPNMAAKILELLAQPYHIGKNQLSSTPSIGIALYPSDGCTADELMMNADTSMYHAKSEGKNNYQFFSSKLNKAANEIMSLERELRTAMQNEQFSLYYQPKIELANGCITSVEALLRWHHPQRGLVPPDKFIHIAEESGIINTLGEWVLEEACRQLAKWKSQGLTLNIAVNLSPKQLRDKEIISKIKQLIEKYDLKKDELELEVTETAAMTNAKNAIKQMHEIRSAGATLAIDDFGTGYSSLAYLKLFPVQVLKLDRTFVCNIEENGDDATICSASISLAHNLGMKVVAEGVETEAQKDFLVGHQCDYMQGYLFSRPLPVDEVTSLLNENKVQFNHSLKAVSEGKFIFP